MLTYASKTPPTLYFLSRVVRECTVIETLDFVQ